MDSDRARTLLETERDRLRTALRTPEMAMADTESGSLSESADIDQHPADMGTETFEREKNFSIRLGLEEELRDVESALERLGEGSYGTCQVCGKTIPDERLEALPGTRYCVEHAREAERRRAAG